MLDFLSGLFIFISAVILYYFLRGIFRWFENKSNKEIVFPVVSEPVSNKIQQTPIPLPLEPNIYEEYKNLKKDIEEIKNIVDFEIYAKKKELNKKRMKIIEEQYAALNNTENMADRDIISNSFSKKLDSVDEEIEELNRYLI